MIKNTPDEDVENNNFNVAKKSKELKTKEIQEIQKDIISTDFFDDGHDDILDHGSENIEDLKSVILNSTNVNEEI